MKMYSCSLYEGLSMRVRLFLYGLGIWFAATLSLRIWGQRMLHPGDARGTLLLFVLSSVATAWIARRLCKRVQLPRPEWPAGAISLLLPTLVLDPFSSAFFPIVFPNMPREVPVAFAGSMLR